MKTILIILALLVTREILAYVFGWESELPFADYFETVKHNRAIDREWKKNGRPIVSTTIGWRRDPWNKEDGYKDNGNGSYSKLIRGGTKEYREKFAKDIEDAKQ